MSDTVLSTMAAAFDLATIRRGRPTDGLELLAHGWLDHAHEMPAAIVAKARTLHGDVRADEGGGALPPGR